MSPEPFFRANDTVVLRQFFVLANEVEESFEQRELLRRELPHPLSPPQLESCFIIAIVGSDGVNRELANQRIAIEVLK
jgi:hypothetical protein